jgi:hypothetical protein
MGGIGAILRLRHEALSYDTSDAGEVNSGSVKIMTIGCDAKMTAIEYFITVLENIKIDIDTSE